MPLDLGAVNARVQFDATAFKTGVDQCIGQLRRLQAAGASMGSATQAGLGGVSDAYKRVQAQLSGTAEAAKTAGNEIKQASEKGVKGMNEVSMASLKQVYVLRQLGSIAGQFGQSMQMAGERAVRALAGVVEAGANLNQTMVMIRNNTLLTNDEFAEMSNEVKRLGATTGADMGQIAMGVRHIRDYGFQGKEAMDMLNVATKAAVATGSDAGETAQLLGRVMKVFARDGMGASEAMNAIWFAAANSNLMMKDFVGGTERAIAMAGPFKIRFQELAAMISTFAKNGMSARLATTNFVNDLNKLAQPTSKASKYLEQLDKMSGPKLTQVFTAQWIQANGIFKAFELIQEKARATGLSITDMVMKLFPSLRGTAGALLLSTKEGLNEFASASAHLGQILGGSLSPLTDRYNETLKQLGPQLAQLRNTFLVMAADIASIVVPAIRPVLEWAKNAVAWFRDLPSDVKAMSLGFVALAAASAVIVGKLLGVLQVIIQIREAVMLINAIQGTTGILGALGLAGAGPYIAAAVAGIGILGGAFYLLTRHAKSAGDAMQEAIGRVGKAQEAVTQAEAVKALGEQYQKLSEKHNKTKADLAKIADLRQQIVNYMPTVASTFDKDGKAADLAADFMRRLNDELERGLQLRRETNKEVARLQVSAISGEIERNKVLIGTYNFAKSQDTRFGGPVFGGAAMGAGTPQGPPSLAQQQYAYKRLQELLARQKALQSDLVKARVVAATGVPFAPTDIRPSPKPTPGGGAVTVPGTKELAAAAKAAREELRAQIEILGMEKGIYAQRRAQADADYRQMLANGVSRATGARWLKDTLKRIGEEELDDFIRVNARKLDAMEAAYQEQKAKEERQAAEAEKRRQSLIDTMRKQADDALEARRAVSDAYVELIRQEALNRPEVNIEGLFNTQPLGEMQSLIDARAGLAELMGVPGPETTFSNRGIHLGGGTIGDVSKQLRDAAKSVAEQERIPLESFNLGASLMKNITDGIFDGFRSAMDKLLGGKKGMNPFVKIFSNVISEFVQNSLQNVFKSMGKGGKGVGKLGTGDILGSLLGVGLSFLKFADGGWVPGPVGTPRAAVVHGGEYVVPAGGGGPSANITMNIHAAPGMNVRELARQVAYETYRMMPARPGS